MTSVSGDQSPRADISSAQRHTCERPHMHPEASIQQRVGDLRAPSGLRTQSRSALWRRRRRPGVLAESVGKDARGAGRRRGAVLRSAGWSVRELRPQRAICPAFLWLFRARAEPRRRGRGCRSRTCGSGALQVSGLRRTFAHAGRLVGTLLSRASVPVARNGSGGAASGPSRRFQTYRHQGLPFPPLRRGWAERNSALCRVAIAPPAQRARPADAGEMGFPEGKPAAPAARRAGPGEGELVEAPVPEVRRSSLSRGGDCPGAPRVWVSSLCSGGFGGLAWGV